MSLTVSNRDPLRRKTTEKGLLTPLGLEVVRDNLRALQNGGMPQDFLSPLRDLHIDFTGGVMQGSWRNASLGGAGNYLVTTTAASQLAQEVLPSRFWPGLKQHVALNAQRATGVWSDFSNLHDRDVRVRTCRMSLPDGATRRVEWVIRAMVSKKYARYLHVQFVEDLLQNTESYAKLPVLDWWLTDNEMRIRFAGLDPTTNAFAHLDPEGLKKQPLPFVEVWNSETACRSVVLVGGVWRAINNTGFAWHGRRERSWNHVGSMARMSERVQGEFGAILADAALLADLYMQAQGVAIEPEESLGDWTEQQLRKYQETNSDTFVVKARKALEDPTVSDNASLASAVDAIALAAQGGDTGLARQHEIEAVASQILIWGLDKSKGTGVLHYVPSKRVTVLDNGSDIAMVPSHQALYGLGN